MVNDYDNRMMMAAACAFAMGAHGGVGQKRKYTGENYVEHPIAVADMVTEVLNDPVASCAAVLHDVLEDTFVTREYMAAIFGEEITALVEEVTDISRPDDGCRAVRKAIDRAHLAKASPRAKTIKLADLINNTESIVKHDPKFAAVYLQEKLQLLEVLKEGNEALYQRATQIAQEGLQLLKETT